MLWRLILLIAIGATGPKTSLASLVYAADFSVNGQGSTHDNTGGDPLESSPVAGANWSISFGSVSTDSTTNEFITSGGVMRVQDWGGNGTLESTSIDVSGWNTVDLDGMFTNLIDINAAGEFLNFFYTLDGGSPVATLVDDNSSVGPLSQWDINALDVSGVSNMTVGFSLNVDGGGQGWEVSSLTVNGVSAVPEPSQIILFSILGLLLPLIKRTTRSIKRWREN